MSTLVLFQVELTPSPKKTPTTLNLLSKIKTYEDKVLVDITTFDCVRGLVFLLLSKE